MFSERMHSAAELVSLLQQHAHEALRGVVEAVMFQSITPVPKSTGSFESSVRESWHHALLEQGSQKLHVVVRLGAIREWILHF